MSTAAVEKYLRHLDARRSTLRDEIDDDVAPLRGLTLAQRAQILESVCRDAMAILRARPDFDQAVAHREPRSPDSEATWLRLVQEFRRTHGRH